MLHEAGLDYLAESSGTKVTKQMPLPEAEVLVDTTVLLYTGNGSGSAEGEGEQVAVPDVTKKSVREVNNILTSAGLRLQIEGSGISVRQDPPADTVVAPDTVVTVSFEPPK